MAKKEDLIKVAEELQEKFEFEPAIKTKGKSEKDLEAVIKEAAAELTPEDEISKTAKTLFKELGIKIGAKAEPAEEEEEEEEEEEVAVPAKAAKKAPAKPAKAEVADEDEEEEETEEVEEEEDETPAKPAKKAPAKEKDPNEVKLSTQEKAAFFKPLIETGKYTVAELLKKAQEKHAGVSDSSLKTFLSDSKNEKYNKFDKLVVAGEDGKLSFKGAVKKAKA